MAFFLLGRVDDTLTLLCPETFATRQDALAALSHLTAEPEFTLWNAEVLMLDTDAGTPVLLVRPATPAPAASIAPVELPVEEVPAEAEVELAEEVSAEPELEPLEEVRAEPEVEPAEDICAEPEVKPAEEVRAEPEMEPVEELDEPLETVVVEEPSDELAGSVTPVVVDEFESAAEVEPVEAQLAEPVADDAIADAITEEYLESTQPDAAEALKAALTRTTAHMEAEGIVAPESIGAAAPASTQTDAAWPWHVGESGSEEPVAAAAEPSDFVFSTLEEPSLDDGPLLRTTIDDEMFAAAKPVIMGSYAGEDGVDSEMPPAPIQESVVEPMGSGPSAPRTAPPGGGFAIPVIGDAGDVFAVEEPVAEAPVPESDHDELLGLEDALDALVPDADPSPATEGVAEATTAIAAETPSDNRDISDFILDLGPVPSAKLVVETPVSPTLDEYTCKDCVYEQTCPNKDQRLPKDCGSFQWR